MSVPDEPTVLVPLAVLDGESLAPALIEALSGVSVELVGYHELPEQTPPGQARMQFEERMQGELDDLAAAFADAGGTVETRMVFTHEPTQTFERVAVEESCDAVLLNNPAQAVEDVLVPLRGEVNVERIAMLVAAVLEATDATATLYHVAETDDERGEGQALVEAAAERLAADGVAADRFREEVVVSETPRKTLVAAASDADLVVMGESRPSVRELFFGEVSEQVASQSVTPALVVRRLPAVDDGDGANVADRREADATEPDGEPTPPDDRPDR
ncbi:MULTISPECIES: universal stress protein [Halorussus]|uniref:universal stress protein n=1 Tax=Halorussus TaxID=1070314 RepID=UPI000E20E7E6|nr:MULTISPECIES: universal stress protein [Halorussus]NHN58645.1 universal stress protein [Halorussus sp. JP-T4]